MDNHTLLFLINKIKPWVKPVVMFPTKFKYNNITEMKYFITEHSEMNKSNFFEISVMLSNSATCTLVKAVRKIE